MGGGGGGEGGGEWSDSDEDEDEGGRAAGGQIDSTMAAADEPDEIEYDPEARSVTLTLNGAIVSLDIEIQVFFASTMLNFVT